MPGTPDAALVFAAAPVALTPRLSRRLAGLDRPYVVAADGGAATALAAGFRPDVVVGDLDSIDADVLADLRHHGVPIETHPRDKDATDGQLAVDRALQAGPSRLLLLGFVGGPRLDQAVANVLFLAHLQVPAVLVDEHNECTLMQPGRELAWDAEPDEVVSLLALDTEVTGIRTHGLRWPLHAARLRLGDTRGVSNEPVAAQVRVSIEAGRLLVTRHFPADVPYSRRVW